MTQRLFRMGRDDMKKRLMVVVALCASILAAGFIPAAKVYADSFTTVVMTYDDKVYTRQIYDLDVQQIKAGVETEGIKGIKGQCDNINYVSNGAISVDRNAVAAAVTAQIVAGQTNIAVDLKQYDAKAGAASASALSATPLAPKANASANDAATQAALAALAASAAVPTVVNPALNAMGIDCKISESTTYFNAKQDRAVNVRNAASKINGMILQPGAVFSANLFFGPRVPENGYGLGNIISGGGYIKGYGGGICQVSSTLNVAVLRAGIIPIERHAHSHSVGYLPVGLDATISAGTLDYQFVNTLAYPICIMANGDGGTLHIELYSNHDALGGITYEPRVSGGAVHVVGKAGGVVVSDRIAYSSGR